MGMGGVQIRIDNFVSADYLCHFLSATINLSFNYNTPLTPHTSSAPQQSSLLPCGLAHDITIVSGASCSIAPHTTDLSHHAV
jgi:hypothetical protein